MLAVLLAAGFFFVSWGVLPFFPLTFRLSGILSDCQESTNERFSSVPDSLTVFLTVQHTVVGLVLVIRRVAEVLHRVPGVQHRVLV